MTSAEPPLLGCKTNSTVIVSDWIGSLTCGLLIIDLDTSVIGSAQNCNTDEGRKA